MTLKEAKKILNKEGFHMALANKVIYQNSAIREFEKPEVCEAIKVANANRWTVGLSPTEWDEREARLKKEYEERSNAPVPGKEQQEEKIRIICCSASPKADFYYKHFLNEGNPALKESASQFNDALLDEQAKEIKCIKEKNLRLGREIARLNKNIYKKNMKIEELRKESSRHLRGKIKMFGENVDLEQMLKDKDAVLADVAEELRLSKIREKNLTELCQKYIKENEELKKKLADKVVDKIDAQALKSAESALAYKDSYIEKLKNKKVINNRASMEAIAKYVDAVSKAELDGLVLESWKNDGKEITSVYQLKNGKRYTLSLVYTGEEFLYYKTDLDKKPHISTPEISQEELMKIQEKVVASCDIAEEGGDHSAIIVQCYKDITTISKDEAEIIERCTKNGTELHYSEKDGFTYTNVFGNEMPIIYLRGIFHVFTDEEIKNMKK